MCPALQAKFVCLAGRHAARRSSETRRSSVGMGGENLDESDLFYFFWRGNQSDLANHKQVHSKHR
jgi:hypothetical protein